MINLINKTINDFFTDLKNGSIKVDEDFDNEFGMQFELGIRLRNTLVQNGFAGQGYKVYFEKNIKNICRINKWNYNDTLKKEIDLLVAKTSNGQVEELYAIELKFPRNGQYPEQMYSFVKDLAFIAQLKGRFNFKGCWSVVLVDNDNFCKTSNRKTTNTIYTYFREDRNVGDNLKRIGGTIQKPTGKYKYQVPPFINIPAGYEKTVQWNSINQNLYYYIMQV
ncbi:MAG: hypothetical protein ACLSU0_00255 [Oscillospiraceae bacterium]